MKQNITDIYLITGGQYHDIDYARLALLSLLAEHACARVRVAADYTQLDALETTDALISYSCNIIPPAAQMPHLTEFLKKGGKWLALHGTNSILAQNAEGRWFAPEDETGFMALLGSQFAAHPPIAPYDIKIEKPNDPLLEGLGDFTVEGGDELYYMRLFGEIEVLLSAKSQGAARGFVERTWDENASHPVLYRKKYGKGEIVYFTLGHRRGHYDMRPLIDYYPEIEHGAWENETYMEILRRAIAWTIK